MQKAGDEYEKFEEGNILSLDTLFSYISTVEQGQGKSMQKLKSEFRASCIRHATNSLKAVKGKLRLQKHNFELLGFDFIIDTELRNYLIEANTNPCLEESNELLRRLLPRMIDDTLNLVCDPIFNLGYTNCDQKYKSKFNLKGSLFGIKHPGYPATANLWEEVCIID